MITISSIGSINYTEYDEIWAIVRSLKNQNQHIKQVADLSPSKDLFYRYLGWRNEGQWNKQKFQEEYVPQFLRELKQNHAALELLSKLWDADRAGKRICLVCFCTDEELCHRSIIAGILQGAGCRVNGVRHDYSDYYKSYMT